MKLALVDWDGTIGGCILPTPLTLQWDWNLNSPSDLGSFVFQDVSPFLDSLVSQGFRLVGFTDQSTLIDIGLESIVSRAKDFETKLGLTEHFIVGREKTFYYNQGVLELVSTSADSHKPLISGVISSLTEHFLEEMECILVIGDSIMDLQSAIRLSILFDDLPIGFLSSTALRVLSYYPSVRIRIDLSPIKPSDIDEVQSWRIYIEID